MKTRLIPPQLQKRDDVINHLIELSPEDRYTRFCSVASDEFIHRYVYSAQGLFYGWKDFSSGKCVALMHLVFDKKTRNVEIAISVLPEYKGKGYAKALIQFAYDWANSICANKVVINGLSENSPMIRLAKKSGFDISTYSGEFEGQMSTIGSDLQTMFTNNIKAFTIIRDTFIKNKETYESIGKA